MATITLRSSGFPLTNDQIDANFVAINTEVGSIISTLLPLKANANNAVLTGNPTAPTQLSSDNSDRIATTAYVNSKFGNAMVALSPLTPSANQIVYYTSGTTAALTTLSAFGRTLIDDADAAAARTTLGLGTAATQTVTTSRSDSNEGRVLKVGDYGVGRVFNTVNNFDYNAFGDNFTSGFNESLQDLTPSNGPPTGDNYYIQQLKYQSNPLQIAWPYRAGVEDVWLRSRLSGTWSSWYKMLTTKNTLDIGTSASNARTVLGLGTAATQTVTTSATDTTAGRLLKVGDFGNGTPISLAANTDLNTVVTSGDYRINATPVNGPAAYNVHYSCMNVVVHSDTAYQIIVHYAGDLMFFRGGNLIGGVWNWRPWSEVYNSNNLLNIGTTAASARTALGLGSLATLSSVALTNMATTARGDGKQTIWVPAGAMRPRATNGAQSTTVQLPTNGTMVSALAYDTATEEYAQFQVRMPKSWNEGTITCTAVWTADSTSTASVVWAVRAKALANDATIDAAWGTAVAILDANTATAYQVHISPESAAMTVSGASELGWVVFEVFRQVANGSDTLAVDALLLGVTINYTTDAANDA